MIALKKSSPTSEEGGNHVGLARHGARLLYYFLLYRSRAFRGGRGAGGLTSRAAGSGGQRRAGSGGQGRAGGPGGRQAARKLLLLTPGADPIAAPSPITPAAERSRPRVVPPCRRQQEGSGRPRTDGRPQPGPARAAAPNGTDQLTAVPSCNRQRT
ncbi:zinc finger X-linked protein ZXDB-like [Numida meleagris]|uniref:zinc finger X-linked protein ZXDB-like n=1 Tax=Numida meleagris TaxID=8996 RepID=UPI000B3DECAA|nr:zinc finger X-linked protein ZXDB-like [Numida meleagris]